MGKVRIGYEQHLAKTLQVMSRGGLLLVGAKPDGSSNIMTIGWGSIGTVWGRPVFTVLVRPSRYTQEFMEEGKDFTVNVPSESLAEAVSYCGTVSGRDHSKAADKNLTLSPGQEVGCPIIEECLIHYECRKLLCTEIHPAMLDGEIQTNFYPADDFHRLYYGEIVCVTADSTL